MLTANIQNEGFVLDELSLRNRQGGVQTLRFCWMESAVCLRQDTSYKDVVWHNHLVSSCVFSYLEMEQKMTRFC